MKNIEINTEKLEIIINSLDEKVKNVTNTLNDIELKMSKINGNEDTWQGEAQESVYKNYLTISKNFPNIVEQLENYSKFLKTTVTNYKTGEHSIDSDIIENKENLEVN